MAYAIQYVDHKIDRAAGDQLHYIRVRHAGLSIDIPYL